MADCRAAQGLLHFRADAVGAGLGARLQAGMRQWKAAAG